jgi:hydroxylamine dehydrogenase
VAFKRITWLLACVLPTTFAGKMASEYLIDKSEQEKRLSAMKAICNSCHNIDWIYGHFAKLESTLRETNEMTLAATNSFSKLGTLK